MAEARKAGSFVHVDMLVKDHERAKRFYGDLFGWTFQDVPEMNYTLFQAPNMPGGFRSPMEEDPGVVLDHILVESVDETASRIEAAGGTMLTPKTEVPGEGWFAIFQDPEGTAMAIWESSQKEQ